MISKLATPRTSPSEASLSSPASTSYDTPPSSPEVQLVKKVFAGEMARGGPRGGVRTVGGAAAGSTSAPAHGEHTPMPARPAQTGAGAGEPLSGSCGLGRGVPPVPSRPKADSVQGQPHGCSVSPPVLDTEGVLVPWTPTLGKHKPVPDAVLVQHGLAPGLSVLVGTQGAYAFFPAHTGGAYGKVHYAVRLDGTGAPLVVKAVRQNAKGGESRLDGARKTFEASLQQVNQEFCVHQALRYGVATIGPHLHERLLWRGKASLRTFVGFERPSEVLELVADVHHRDKAGAPSPKAYLVSTCELGDVDGVYRALWRRRKSAHAREARRLAARSVAYQTFVELHVLHQAVKHAHFDVKLGNLHVNEAGAVRLADCGFALPLDASGRVAFCGPRGSIVGPEMFLPAAFGRTPRPPPRLDRGTDVWAAWVASLQLLVPPSVQMPFRVVRVDAERGAEERHDLCLAELRAFVHGAEDLVPRLDGLPRLRRVPDGAGVWPSTGNAVVDAFFGAAAAADPRLVEVALARGLRFRASKRASAYDQAQAVGELLRWTPRQASAWWKTLLYRLADEPRRQAIYGQLHRFASLTPQLPALAPYLRRPRAAGAPPPEDGAPARAPEVFVCPRLTVGPPVVGGGPSLRDAIGAGASMADPGTVEQALQVA